MYLRFSSDFAHKNIAADMMRHLSLHLCPSPPWTDTHIEWNHKQNTKGKAMNIIRKTICLSLFSSLSLAVPVCLSDSFSFSLSSSNNSKIKLHYAPFYWSFATFKTAFSAGQRRKWLMTHDVLIESFLSGQIILTMWPLNSIIGQNGILNSLECYWCF